MSATVAQGPRPSGPRVGLIIPSVNATIEPDFVWAAPRILSFHTARVMLGATTPDGLRAMNREVEGAARLLATLKPALVAFACTSGSFLEGEAGLTRQLDEIGAVAGCPVVATSRAMVEALRALGVTRLALATPYLEPVNELERAYLAGHGFDVIASRGLGLSGQAIREVEPDRVARLVREVDRPEAEAVFVSCTDLRAFEVAAELERELGKPVLTSNTVTLWAIARALGTAIRADFVGRLAGLEPLATARRAGASP